MLIILKPIDNLCLLPNNLATHPYLIEFYGTVAWSVKGVFTSYLGWFSGDPIDLQPLTLKNKSKRMMKLIGEDKMLDAAKTAFKDKDYQWALELSTYILNCNPDNYDAREIKIDALTLLGSRQISACGRNYFLTAAFEEASEIKIRDPQHNREMGASEILFPSAIFLHHKKCLHRGMIQLLQSFL
jgi:alkyl sulfatase BDS1-like metallo-beta-lactamase superfamily hydrolase